VEAVISLSMMIKRQLWRKGDMFAKVNFDSCSCWVGKKKELDTCVCSMNKKLLHVATLTAAFKRNNNNNPNLFLPFRADRVAICDMFLCTFCLAGRLERERRNCSTKQVTVQQNI
jgi:hypothetical protein